VIRLALTAASRVHDETTTATDTAIQHEADTPLVSVIVPARNEERSLEHCLASIVQQSYPKERVDVVVVENRSTDRTREVAERWAERHSQVRVLVSDAVNQAAAMNEGLQLAKGDVIARVDAHSWIDEHYVRNAVDALGRHPEAAGVGGPFLPVGTALLERVSGLARSSRLGVGSGYGSDRRTDEHPVQTVQCGVFRRDALEAIGGFDVAMAYGEDEDLNWRLLKRGRAIILCPGLRQFYRPRPNLYALARQYWNYGQGRLRVVLKHPDFLRVKHLVPSALVTTLVSFALLAPFAPLAQRALVGLLYCYGFALAGAALFTAPTGWLAAALLPLAIVSMHFGYGAGMLWGFGRHVFGRLCIHGKLGEGKQCRDTSGPLRNR
jgi:glycosyltransferase involved in cell wall biosynthesis